MLADSQEWRVRDPVYSSLILQAIRSKTCQPFGGQRLYLGNNSACHCSTILLTVPLRTDLPWLRNLLNGQLPGSNPVPSSRHTRQGIAASSVFAPSQSRRFGMSANYEARGCNSSVAGSEDAAAKPSIDHTSNPASNPPYENTKTPNREPSGACHP